MQLKSNYKTFDLLEASERDEMMAGHRRKVLTLVLNGTTYADVAAALTDGATLTIVDEQGHDNVITDRTKAGAITDNRDGTITAKMGASNTVEQDLQDEVASKSEIITAIAGKAVQTIEEAAAVRADVESLFSTSSMDDDGKIKIDFLCPAWSAGNHTKGESYTAAGQTWECYQSYDNAVYPDIIPGNPAWYTFNRPLHGKSQDTARPWVAPQGAHDMYHTGEYMIYTDGKLYKCLSDTNFSPEEYPQAWEKQRG